MPFILTNLPLAPGDSLSPNLHDLYIYCPRSKPEARLSCSISSRPFSNASQFSCDVIISSFIERCLLFHGTQSPVASPAAHQLPLSLESRVLPLTWPSGELWFSLMRLELMDLEGSQGLVNFRGRCGRPSSDSPALLLTPGILPTLLPSAAGMHRVQMGSQRQISGSWKISRFILIHHVLGLVFCSWH